MRALVLLLCLFAGLQTASAQTNTLSNLSAEFQLCRSEIQILESQLAALHSERRSAYSLYESIKDSVYEKLDSSLVSMSDKILIDRLRVNARDVSIRHDLVLREISAAEKLIARLKRRCENLGAELVRRRYPGLNPKDTALARDVRSRVNAAKQAIAQTKRHVEQLERQIAALRQKILDRPVNVSLSTPAPFAARFSLFGDLGRPLTEVERRFPAFGQTLEETANGGWYGSLGLQADTPSIFDGPLARVWFTAAATMFYLNTKLQRVTNDGGGQVSSTGNDLLRGVALLAGFGGRFHPNDPLFGRWEWQLLGGVGYALNSIRGLGPAGGEQFSGSEHVTPWLGRFALYYSITDNLKAGLALSLITTPEITGRLPSGTQFQIGRVTNYVAALSMVYSFHTASQGR